MKLNRQGTYEFRNGVEGEYLQGTQTKINMFGKPCRFRVVISIHSTQEIISLNILHFKMNPNRIKLTSCRSKSLKAESHKFCKVLMIEKSKCGATGGVLWGTDETNGSIRFANRRANNKPVAEVFKIMWKNGSDTFEILKEFHQVGNLPIPR